MRGVVSGNIGSINKSEFIGQYFLLAFSVAEDTYLGGKKGTVTTWHNCEWWGKAAENGVKHLDVGMHVDVFGQTYIEEYETREGKGRKLCVKVADVAFKPKASGTVGDYQHPNNDDNHAQQQGHQQGPGPAYPSEGEGGW